MKRIIQILGGLLLVAVLISFMPVVVLYLRPEGPPCTNKEAIERIRKAKGEHFGFIVTSDTHNGLLPHDAATLKLVRHMNREGRYRKLPIDFVLIAGDITFRGSWWDYKIFNKIRNLIKMPVLVTAGNHDDDKKNSRDLFKKYVGKAEYAFAHQNAYFIFADNTFNDFQEPQFAWFETELIRSQAYRHRFVIMHKPPLSPYQRSWYRPELSRWAPRFIKLCEKYRVTMVLTGHEHIFAEQTIGGVRYITTGGGGSITDIPVAGGGYLHYTVVRVWGDHVDYEVRRVFPPLWSYLAFYLWQDLFFLVRDVLY